MRKVEVRVVWVSDSDAVACNGRFRLLFAADCSQGYAIIVDKWQGTQHTVTTPLAQAEAYHKKVYREFCAMLQGQRAVPNMYPLEGACWHIEGADAQQAPALQVVTPSAERKGEMNGDTDDRDADEPTPDVWEDGRGNFCATIDCCGVLRQFTLTATDALQATIEACRLQRGMSSCHLI